MKTIILHNIISSNTVYKINSYISKNKKDLGNILVLFCSETEQNRRWSLNEKPEFKFRVLSGFPLKLKGKDLFTYFINPSTLKELKDFKPDRIIISGWDQFAYQLAYFWGFINKKKITIWAGSTDDEKSWRRTATLPLVKMFIKIANNYIAYGKRSKEYFIKLGAKPDNVSVFLNDVNKNYFQKEAKKWRKERGSIKNKLRLNKKFNFIYVGQFIKRKGLLNLLDAYKKFSKTNSDWGLVTVGYGQLEGNIKAYIKENDIKDVVFLGLVEQYDLPKIYTACDCLILPSVEEVWGLVVNEAMHCGLKVIVSDVCGCVPDLIRDGENGYIFNSGSISDLLLSLEKVTKDISKNYKD